MNNFEYYFAFIFQIEKATLKEHNENLLKLSLRKDAAPEISDLKANFLKQVYFVFSNPVY